MVIKSFPFLLTCVVTFATLFSVVASQLVTANVDLAFSNDKRRIIEVGSFGYTEGGVVSITINKLIVSGLDTSSAGTVIPSTGAIGFVIDTVDTVQTARSERDFSKAEASCFADSIETDPRVIDPQNGARIPIFLNGTLAADYNNKAGKPVVISRTIGKRSLYGIFYFNCLPGNPAVTLSIHVDQYNVDAAGQRNYLSFGDRPLGSVYLVFCLVFGGLLLYWKKLVSAKSQHVKRVHSVVTFLIVIKCLSLLFETFKYFHYASTGERDMWDFLYYVFLTLKGVTLFAVVVLLGSGWSSARAFLTENDRKLLLFLLPAQVFINVSIAVLEETSEGVWWWGKLLDVFRLLDVVCLLAVLLPLVWSMRSLNEAAEQQDKAAVNLVRMRTFRTFYLVFVGYIYATRVLLVVIIAGLPFYLLWIGKVFRESCAVALYSYIVYAFQPGPAANPYELLDPDHQPNPEDGNEQHELKDRQELQPPEEIS